MSELLDLIAQVTDVNLRARIRAEAEKLLRQKKFGLVFEEHTQECCPLYGVPPRPGCTVTRRDGKLSELYTVRDIVDGTAYCRRKDGSGEQVPFPVADLLCVAEFGEPIYPYLAPIAECSHAPDSAPWHTLIEADNFHALQLLAYLYPGKVDCIYIDPPYNTGARDWKYNNDYVDSSDAYRHSKWLSMMEKRLRLAKKLLNPTDSVLIVTIDEKEYLHLGCLLEEMFPEARMQMVSCCINPAGVSRTTEFCRTDEYVYFVKFGACGPSPLKLSDEWMGSVMNTSKKKAHWDSLLRTGTSNMRKDCPNLFYPIYVSEDGKRFLGAGEPLPLEQNKESITPLPGVRAIWPMHRDGAEGRWQLGKDTLLDAQKRHFVRLGGFTDRGMAISYMKAGQQKKVERGEYKIMGIKPDNSYILNDDNYVPAFIPGTQWSIPLHDASRHGSGILRKIFNDKIFSFPKSLYAVHDTIRFFVADKPHALILDFFAGSGTTLHAVNLLNAEDGGERRCILVTNNEVSEAEAKTLTAQGHRPGDAEWEALGIAHHVTWPRTVCSMEGHDVNGAPLKGEYLGSGRPMAEGFAANAAFFRLGFLDKTSVALGRQFRELLPLLWMKAGAHGRCPKLEDSAVLPSMIVLPENRFAVLLTEECFPEFEEKLRGRDNIETIYIVADYEENYRAMCARLGKRDTYRLYKDYSDNFRINHFTRK